MQSIAEIGEIQRIYRTNHIYAKTVFFSLPSKENYLAKVSQIIAERPKPFVKWVGGKRQLLEQFKTLGLYPPEHFDPITGRYFEPFVGGGAVFFDLMPRHAHLSDMNEELVIAYNVIKNDVESLIKSLKKHKHNKEYFLKIRAKKVTTLTELERASRFIYLNRTCFNGMYRVNSKGEFNVPFGRYDNPTICDEENLRKVSKALTNVSIRHEDYKEAVRTAKKGDFVYFDPPYHPLNKTSSFTSYTKGEFGEKEQVELRDTYLELHKRGCYVMLSNSNSEFINAIYGELKNHGIKVHKVHANRAINSVATSRGKIKEVLVTNY